MSDKSSYPRPEEGGGLGRGLLVEKGAFLLALPPVLGPALPGAPQVPSQCLCMGPLWVHTWGRRTGSSRCCAPACVSRSLSCVCVLPGPLLLRGDPGGFAVRGWQAAEPGPHRGCFWPVSVSHLGPQVQKPSTGLGAEQRGGGSGVPPG